MNRRLAFAATTVVLLALAVGCSDSDNGSDGSSTTDNRGFEVQTPEGQVSLSLSGSLPPNWPDDFPVPSGAEPAGSGSLGGESQTGFVGVYSVSQPPEDVYDFYRDHPDLQVDRASSVGSGNTYLGTVGFGGEWNGYVVIVPYDGETLAIILLNQTAPGTTMVGPVAATAVPAPPTSATVAP